jgi:inhibitor of KinA sporulation pathway (predicted exonuclease)
MFEKRVLRRKFGQKKDEVILDWRKLHEELHDLYSSPSMNKIMKSTRMRWAGHVARVVDKKKNAYRLLVRKPGGKRPLRKPKRRWVFNIRMDLVEVGWEDVDWIDLALNRDRWRALVNSVLNLRVI